MEPKFEQPKQYTPEEIAEMEKSRTISDAELLKGGAEYVVSEEGEKENLLVTNKQKSDINMEAKIIDEYPRVGNTLQSIEKQHINVGDFVYIYMTEPNKISDQVYYGRNGADVLVMKGRNKVKGVVREISGGYIKVRADTSDSSAHDAFIKSPDISLFLGSIDSIKKED